MKNDFTQNTEGGKKNNKDKIKNDFIMLFKTLKPAEQKAFGQYLTCFYEPQKVVRDIFKEVEQAIAKNQEVQYLKSAKDPKKTFNALSDLKKWLIEFLTIQELKNNSYESQFVTLEALRKRKLQPFFEQKSKQLNQELAEHPSPDIWMLFWKLRLSHINYFDTPIAPLKDHQQQMADILGELDDFSTSAKLKYSTELYSAAYIRAKGTPNELWAELELLINNTQSMHPIVKQLYLPLLNMTKNKSTEAYSLVKTFLIKNENHRDSEKQYILLSLLNFAISRIRANDKAFYGQYFELVELGIAQSIFIASGYFPAGTFINIVNMACHLEEYKWAEDFKTQSAPYLDEKYRDEIEKIAKARIQFGEKKFNDVIEILLRIQYRNFAFSIHERTLLIRAYYEEQDKKQKFDDNIIQECQNFNIYLKRSDDISKDIEKSGSNFAKMVLKLVKSKNKAKNVNELNKSKTEIGEELRQSTEPIMFLEWLKQKAAA